MTNLVLVVTAKAPYLLSRMLVSKSLKVRNYFSYAKLKFENKGVYTKETPENSRN